MGRALGRHDLNCRRVLMPLPTEDETGQSDASRRNVSSWSSCLMERTSAAVGTPERYGGTAFKRYGYETYNRELKHCGVRRDATDWVGGIKQCDAHAVALCPTEYRALPMLVTAAQGPELISIPDDC
jgi:hypothetical protein